MARPRKTSRLRAKLKNKWKRARARAAGFLVKKKAGSRAKMSHSPKRPRWI